MTTPELDGAAATVLMRALLGRSISPQEIARVGWDRLAGIARQNGVLLRAADRFRKEQLAIPASVVDAIEGEQRRAETALALVGRVSAVCTRLGVPFLFPKAIQHLPDVGSDLDLLVGNRSTAIDEVLVRELGAVAVRPDIVSRIAGTATYSVPGGPPLDIQHGRIGAVGEHIDFPARLIAGRRPRTVRDLEFHVPSASDQLVLQGMQRVYGKRRIRLSDIIYTISTIAHDPLDWDYIIRQSRRAGTLRGLSCYLSYADHIQREQTGCPLLDSRIARRLPLAGWGRPRFSGGYYRYPVIRVSARLYPRSLAAQIRTGNWTGAGRLCLVPFLGMLTALRHRVAPMAHTSA